MPEWGEKKLCFFFKSCSAKIQVHVEIEALHDGNDVSEMLTRARFEHLDEDVVKKALKLVQKLFKDFG